MGKQEQKAAKKKRGRTEGSITFREMRLAVQALIDRGERVMQLIERAESSYNYER